MPDSQTAKRETRERSTGKAEVTARRGRLLSYINRMSRPLSAFEVSEGSHLYTATLPGQAGKAERAFDDLAALASTGKIERVGESPVRFRRLASPTAERSPARSVSDGITEADERRGERIMEGDCDDEPPGWEP